QFHNSKEKLNSIGVIANNDFDTYATIVACLLSGITYVPVEPTHPDERNNHVVELSSLNMICSSNLKSVSQNFYTHHRDKFFKLSKNTDKVGPASINPTENPAYILFTSGTTGRPKGVPITRENLMAFVYNINKTGIVNSKEDRFLQIFDLTFDASVFSYLIPLLNGACIFTLKKTSMKYIEAIELISKHAITHVFTVPSFLSYVEPYFKEISLLTIRYWLFCGEALQTKYLHSWQVCLPNAKIFNHYGPTEATVFCTSYDCSSGFIKDDHGIICIGKPFEGTTFELFDNAEHITENFETGELCISSVQLTKGYINNKKENQQKFFKYNGSIYYRTGDLCFRDTAGDYFFKGRSDAQIKINGYRVELREIENAALTIAGLKEAVALAVDTLKITRIVLFVVGQTRYSENDFRSLLGEKLPEYMIPMKVIFISNMPYSLNGKIDKKSLLNYYKHEISNSV
ncbi:MAG TPA: AMP-binding protein, partial [Hanamia sp.]|nr:AMP-binding protein [Hanamia sp.]